MWKKGTRRMPKSSSGSEEVLPRPVVEKEGNFLTLPNWAPRMGKAGDEEQTEVMDKKPFSKGRLEDQGRGVVRSSAPEANQVKNVSPVFSPTSRTTPSSVQEKYGKVKWMIKCYEEAQLCKSTKSRIP